MSDTAWIQLIGFLTLIVGIIAQYFNSQRQWRERELQRQWDIEDRAEKAKQIADKVISQAKVVAREADKSRSQLAEAIQENTDVSTKAFKEANTVNLKLSDLGLTHNKLQQEQSDKIDLASESINTIGLDTQARVKRIEQEVVDKDDKTT